MGVAISTDKKAAANSGGGYVHFVSLSICPG